MNYFEKIKTLPIKENPLIMGIETSCDETAVAIIKDGREMKVPGLSSNVNVKTPVIINNYDTANL